MVTPGQGETEDGVARAIGATFQRSPLHRWRTRWRQRFLPAAERHPLATLLITVDGRKFKMIEADSRNRHLHRVLENLRHIDRLDCVPRLRFQDAGRVVVDYVAGHQPPIDTRCFAAAFGATLARVHGLSVGTTPVESLIREAESALRILREAKALSDDVSSAIASRLRAFGAEGPGVIRTSVVYADWKPNNFIVDGRGKLWLIDIGGFAVGRPTGEYLLGSPLFRSIRHREFHAAYLSAGGNASIFEHASFLGMTNRLRMGAYRHTAARQTTRLDWRHRYALRRSLQAACMELSREIPDARMS